MTLIVDKCYSLRCNAAVDNPLHPQCEMRSPVVYNDEEALSMLAKEGGWTEKGGKHFCPAHPVAIEVVTKPASKPRAPKLATASDNHAAEGQQQ